MEATEMEAISQMVAAQISKAATNATPAETEAPAPETAKKSLGALLGGDVSNEAEETFANRVKTYSSQPSCETFCDLTGRKPTVRDVIEMPSNIETTSLLDELRKTNDALVTTTKCLQLKAMNGGVDKHPIELLKEHTPRLWEKWRRLLGYTQKALDTSDSSDFVPQSYSSQMVNQHYPDLLIEPLIQHITIPRSPLRWPVQGDIGLPYIYAEPTVDEPDKVPTRDPSTSMVTFETAFEIVRTRVSFELFDDSVIEIIPYVNEQLARSLAVGMEEALINGDTTATHMDSAVSTTTDVRRIFNGLRKLAWTGGTSVDDVAALTATSWTPHCFTKMMTRMYSPYDTSDTVVIFPDKLQYVIDADSAWANYQSAAVVTAQLANTVVGYNTMIYGKQIVKSSYIPKTMVNGYNTGAGSNNAAVIAFNPKCFAIATQGTPFLDVQRKSAQTQYELVQGRRVDFKNWYNAVSYPAVSVSFNVPIA